MRTAVLYSVDDPLQVEEGNLGVIDLDKLAAARWQFLQPTGCDPVLHRET
jgi:hypothetical protein